MATTRAQTRARRADEALLAQVRERLRANRLLQRRLSGGGRLRVERQLPFLFAYREPRERPDLGTASLLRGEASYLIASGDSAHQRELETLLEVISQTLAEQFDAFLLVEIWSSAGDGAAARPGFRVVCDPGLDGGSTVDELLAALRRVRISGRRAEVSLEIVPAVAPPDLEPLLPEQASSRHMHTVGIEVRPVYRDPETGDVDPLVRRRLQRQLGRALREAAFEFARRETTFRPSHYHALGRRVFNKTAWSTDARLAELSHMFDLLLMVTPVNTEAAFQHFEKGGFARAPRLLYRPRTIDAPLVKRSLYRIPIERIEDPALAFVFEEKRRELDLKLTLVEERETRRFLATSIALYGGVGADLLAEASDLLAQLPPAPGGPAPAEVDAVEFARRAESMLEGFRALQPVVQSRVELRDELTSLTVSDGNLLVGSRMTFPAHRVEALLQHEVGTHVVTHWNGHVQPFRLLEVGLAGYDELQEGLAVFVEYLVGGLDRMRLRTLGGRVVAAHALIDGASFVETFRQLHHTHGFSARAAFLNTVRVYRGGGLVKDAVYLRGLRAVQRYLERGGDLELLLVGKVATEHAPLIRELKRREVLGPLALRPTYLEDPVARARLERARKGLSLRELLD